MCAFEYQTFQSCLLSSGNLIHTVEKNHNIIYEQKLPNSQDASSEKYLQTILKLIYKNIVHIQLCIHVV